MKRMVVGNNGRAGDWTHPDNSNGRLLGVVVKKMVVGNNGCEGDWFFNV